MYRVSVSSPHFDLQFNHLCASEVRRPEEIGSFILGTSRSGTVVHCAVWEGDEVKPLRLRGDVGAAMPGSPVNIQAAAASSLWMATMRRCIQLGLAVALQATVAAGAIGSSAEFVASTPCDTLPRRFLQISATAPCERITWHLTLSPGNGSGTFSLRVLYGMTVPNTQGLAGGGTAETLTGDWAAGQGADAGSLIRLTVHGPDRSFAFRRIDDNLLHPVDDRGNLLVGNAGWSYTLSRAGAVGGRLPPGDLAPLLRVGDSDAGVFEGRSPCEGLATQLRVKAGPPCLKLKWRLTLDRDPRTNAPSRYLLEGTLFRDQPRKGRWAVERSSADPRVVVVRLGPTADGAFLSFLKADGNVLLFLDGSGRPLVGNADFSYTLNRRRK